MLEQNLITALLKHRRLLIDELSTLTGLDREILMDRLADIGESVKIVGEEVFVRDVLGLVEHALDAGLEIGKLSRLVSWRDFENIASEIMSIHGYETLNNLVASTPFRFQIDVFAIDTPTGRGLVVDCKHWATSSPSRLAEAARNHYVRTLKLAQSINSLSLKYPIIKNTKYLLPIVITLTTPSLRSFQNVLIVSIRELNRFLQEIFYVIEEFKIKPVSVLK